MLTFGGQAEKQHSDAHAMSPEGTQLVCLLLHYTAVASDRLSEASVELRIIPQYNMIMSIANSHHSHGQSIHGPTMNNLSQDGQKMFLSSKDMRSSCPFLCRKKVACKAVIRKGFGTLSELVFAGQLRCKPKSCFSELAGDF